MVYCSQRCQKAHWGTGGHKKYCRAPAASRPQAHGHPVTDSGAAVASRSDANTPGCVICLDAEGELLQRGCCCRGDAGLAHLHCLVELAVHDEKSKNTFAAWHQCGTCKANFTGWVQHGLASTG